MANSTGTFAGVRIVELAQYVFVPSAGALLADQGAELIHVEPVVGGDPYRTLKIADGRETASANLSMEQNNRGKKSLAIDLKTAEGRAIFLRLIATADVFLTSLRPKAIRALGLSVEDLRSVNPRLIYVRGNGFGFSGSDADKAGYDATAFWARGGFAHSLRPAEHDAPLSPRPALGDHTGGIAVAYGIAGALFRRAMTGEPSVVDISLLATALWVLSADIVVSQTQSPEAMSFAGEPDRQPLRRPYCTRDGRWVHLMFLDADRYWAPLCRLLDRGDLLEDQRLATNAGRIAHGPEVCAAIQSSFAARDWAEWQPIFAAWDAPWELVQTIHEVAADPQTIANGYTFAVEVADGSAVTLAAGPVGFDGQHAALTPRRAPHLGEHTDALLGGIGIHGAELARLRNARIIA